MKLLVTGAAGFIGFHLARRLVARGDAVTGLDNRNQYYDVSLKEARLARSIGRSHPIEQPAIVRARYVDQAPPANLPTTVSSPANGSSTTAR